MGLITFVVSPKFTSSMWITLFIIHKMKRQFLKISIVHLKIKNKSMNKIINIIKTIIKIFYRKI